MLVCRARAVVLPASVARDLRRESFAELDGRTHALTHSIHLRRDTKSTPLPHDVKVLTCGRKRSPTSASCLPHLTRTRGVGGCKGSCTAQHRKDGGPMSKRAGRWSFRMPDSRIDNHPRTLQTRGRCVHGGDRARLDVAEAGCRRIEMMLCKPVRIGSSRGRTVRGERIRHLIHLCSDDRMDDKGGRERFGCVWPSTMDLPFQSRSPQARSERRRAPSRSPTNDGGRFDAFPCLRPPSSFDASAPHSSMRRGREKAVFTGWRLTLLRLASQTPPRPPARHAIAPPPPPRAASATPSHPAPSRTPASSTPCSARP